MLFFDLCYSQGGIQQHDLQQLVDISVQPIPNIIYRNMHFWIAFTPGSITKQCKQSAVANQQAGAGGNEQQQ